MTQAPCLLDLKINILNNSSSRVAPPLSQWTDVYKESGPDGLGAMGSEPLLELAAWGLDLGGERQRGAAEATAGHGADKVRCRAAVRVVQGCFPRNACMVAPYGSDCRAAVFMTDRKGPATAVSHVP